MSHGMQQRGGYKDVAVVRDEESKVIAIISQRVGYSQFTCAFFKVFEREGQEDRTSFLDPDKHFDGIVRLFPMVRKKIADLQSQQSWAATPVRCHE